MKKAVEIGTKGADILIQLPIPVYKFYEAFSRFREEELTKCLANILIEDISGLVDNHARSFVIEHFGLEDYSTIPVKGEENE